MTKLGKNITFPIKNADGTSFHDLVLHKATSDSVVMSLSDKITGDVYYKNNALAVTMTEYIEVYKNPDDANETPTKFVLVNPPTIVREGMASDNSQLKGMTKYSFTFYHPMYMLGNFPFADVAVTDDEKQYLSESKKFNWIGNAQDYVAKLNKNLQGTEFVVRISDTLYDEHGDPTEKITTLSDVLTFDNNMIADALKTFYDTYGIPFVIDLLPTTDSDYANGKRYLILMGLPSETIVDGQGNEFVFQFGQGVGLKNNSRTPRNNKIVTRVAGYGSEENIPYGYPQIRWYGPSDWTNTKNDDSDPTAYPIYEGIVGGELVKLIKHPFTRTHLMPTIYETTVFNKVSPYVEGGETNPDYDADTVLVDYYDATAAKGYPNPINPNAPSYESHEFADIKPQLGSETALTSAVPQKWDDATGQYIDDDHWDDTMNDDGEYIQSYFKIGLPLLSFDLYACAAITQQMNVVMRSGACIGCTFPVTIDWDEYKKNFYNNDGVFDPVPHTTEGDGHVRDLTKYPDSSQTAITLLVKKENTTFGTLMPNMYQYPTSGDKIVFTGISLPQSYITMAQALLDDAMDDWMMENNVYYWDYPLKFDEDFLSKHTDILLQIRPNVAIKFMFAATTLTLYVKQLAIKYGEKVLPQYDITLTDNIEATRNAIGQAQADIGGLHTGLDRIGQAVQEITRKDRVKPTGSSSLPIYINGNNEFKEIESLDVPESIRTQKNVEAGGGVAAGGMVDLAIVAGGGSGTLTQIQIDGTALPDTDGVVNIPLATATTGGNGAMSATDKAKLNNIEDYANNYTLPTATTSALGGVKLGYTNSGKNYKLQVDNSGNAYVNVPWDAGSNTASLQVSDTTNKKINTAESTDKFIKFEGGTNKFTIKDAANSSFEVAVSSGITVTSTSVSDGTNTFNKYVHPTSSGYKHVPSGGSSGQFLGWSSDGTATWVNNPNTDTKNTAGSSNKASTKLFLIGAESQAANPQTYSNVNCYIGTDNCLYSNGTKVLTSHQSVVNGGNTASWGSSVTVGTVGGTSLTFTMPSNPNTDTKVTTSGNHYTPTTYAQGGLSADASGADAAWGIDVVKGVALTTDGKGHVTGISVTSGKIPGNPNTNTARLQVSDTTNKRINTKESTGNYIQFTGGTNKITVSDGTNSFDVGVTPSISNNVTGSGTSGYLTKWNGTNTITSGPALSSAISSQTQSTKFLREDGTWSAPSYTTNTDTWRGIKVNSIALLGTGTNTGAVNFVSGTNVTVSGSGNDITISATDTNTTYTFATGASNGQIKVTPSSGSAYNVDVKGLASSAYKTYDTTVTQDSSNLITSGAVWTAIDNLPEPMVFKGSLGTGGTITALPVNGSASIGDTYKVITAGTYASKAAKVGDTFICLTKTSSANTWELIPSGDEPSGTVTSVGLSMPTGFSVSSSPVTSSGTLTVAFASGYSLPTTTKQSNWDAAYGWGDHASAGYAIQANLGTASTHAHTEYVTALSWDSTNSKLAWSKGGTAQTAITIGYASSAGAVAWANVTNHPENLSEFTNDVGYTTNTGTVTKVTAGTGLSVGTTAGGNITGVGTINHTNSVTAQNTQALYPIKIDACGHISAYGTAVTSLPASDVYAWAKASTKPSYTLDEVSDGSTRKLANYLPLTGGTLTYQSTYALALNNAGSGEARVGQILKVGGTNRGIILAGDGYGVAILNPTASYYGIGVKDDGTPYYGNDSTKYKLWHENNDGTGSGLDADKVDGYEASRFFIRDTHRYGLENLCTGVVRGGNTSVVDGKIVTTGTTSDTYFFINTSENLVAGETYTFGFYVEGYTGTGTWAFRMSNNYTCIQISINGNGWFWNTGKAVPDEGTASSQILIDDVGSGNARALTFSKFIVVKGYAFPHYTPPISQMHVAIADNATKLQTARTIWGQSFDGSANVSGAMSGVTTINGVVSFTNKGSSNPVLNIDTVLVSGGIDYTSMYVTATHRPLVLQMDAGNVGIGVAQPTNKLDVAGAIGLTGQLKSSVATGTAPLVVASTTAVSNLNADLLDGQHGSYYAVKVASVGSATNPIYTDANGAFQACTYSLNKTVPSDAVFTDTDVRNTAGGDDTSSKIFLVGMTAQTTSNGNSRTYTQDTAYVGTDGHLYSNSVQVVNLSGSQALTNKTYNGLTLTKQTTGFTIAGGTTSKTLTVNESYTLGAACAKGYTDSSSASAISTGTSLVTERDVYYGLPSINGTHSYQSNWTIYAPTEEGTQGQVLIYRTNKIPGWVDQSTLTSGKATVLETSRNIWGQSFNGSANISGNMSSVGNISFSASGKNIGGLLYFDTTNSRLGINKSSPSYTLDITGDMVASGGVAAGGMVDLSVVAGTAQYVTNIGFSNNQLTWQIGGESQTPITIGYATNAQSAAYASSAGSVAWANVTNKTNATTSEAGLMSATDKAKLDGITTVTESTVLGWGFAKNMTGITTGPSSSTTVTMSTDTSSNCQWIGTNSNITINGPASATSLTADICGVEHCIIIAPRSGASASRTITFVTKGTYDSILMTNYTTKTITVGKSGALIRYFYQTYVQSAATTRTIFVDIQLISSAS